MARLIQDTIRRALADELLFGKLAHGGKVTVDVDESGSISLNFEESAPASPAGGERAGSLISLGPS
jgi:ATP-dependent Clp protease ATP-binding subunit ClpA